MSELPTANGCYAELTRAGLALRPRCRDLWQQPADCGALRKPSIGWRTEAGDRRDIQKQGFVEQIAAAVIAAHDRQFLERHKDSKTLATA